MCRSTGVQSDFIAPNTLQINSVEKGSEQVKE